MLSADMFLRQFLSVRLTLNMNFIGFKICQIYVSVRR